MTVHRKVYASKETLMAVMPDRGIGVEPVAGVKLIGAMGRVGIGNSCVGMDPCVHAL